MLYLTHLKHFAAIFVIFKYVNLYIIYISYFQEILLWCQ